MTALIVILCILLFFVILLLCPVVVSVSYETECRVNLRYLFLTFRVLPARKEAAPPPEETEKEKARQDGTISRIKGIIRQRGLSDFLSLLREVASIAAGTAKKLFSHLVIRSLSVEIAVAAEDAAQTAISYGVVCSAVYPAVGILVQAAKCRKYHIHIVPDYRSEQCRVRFRTEVRILPLFVISAGLSALLRFFRSRLSAGRSIESQKSDKAV